MNYIIKTKFVKPPGEALVLWPLTALAHPRRVSLP